MTPASNPAVLEEQIEQWRSYLVRRRAIHTVDVAELEDHLREQVAGLMDAGLSTDEAFLVAVKRIGNLDSLSREFALEHSERLWKQLVVTPDAGGTAQDTSKPRSDALVAFALAVAAAVMVKLPTLFGLDIQRQDEFYARNASLFVLPLLCGYFVWKRRIGMSTVRWLAVAFAAAILFANIYPFDRASHTQILLSIHLPIALWLAVGVAYAAGRWRQTAGRMDFIRFSGEFFIYFVLIALGGIVLTGLLMVMFTTIHVNAEWFVQQWLIPCGVAGAVIIAAWLVEAKQSVIENMAPVLTRLFTPLFTAVLVTYLATLVITGRAVDIERDMLIPFNALLIIVLALLLYSLSARDTQSPPGAFDVMQVVLLISALIADALALWNIVARITEYGTSPNRIAVLGINVILLVNLAWSAVLYVRFLRKRETLATIERWQTRYLPVYAVWAAIVVIVFPPLFNYT
ncbi:MAG TPA: permease prefix domain 1-containing protein [Gemmatimonadaceae bacterium]|nr:permease prefix domain 1-containing protein [Gemmatimonadaceae bacterium]